MKVCEHEFEREDPKRPGYALEEVDLAAKLNGLAIRRNIKQDKYEIYNHRTGEVQYSYSDLGRIVALANKLEGANYLSHECGYVLDACKKNKQGRCVRDRV